MSGQRCLCHNFNASVTIPPAGHGPFVRALVQLITVSKENSKGATLFADELLEKVQRYAPVQSINIKPNPRNSPDPAVQRETEGEKVLKALDSRDLVVVLDERGSELKSEDLAKLVAAAGDEGRPIAFCIGGPYGHSDAVRGRADRMIRLSSMVLNHQVAVVVLLEQVYRAWTILRGVPYHH
ncbi:hypothetical protein CHLRE_16g680100v5 [Chlamydomonas reinhardtii]|uniref:RNA methyltransferase n=1 Tax=Chlamydomonas reinhardtii TaxID=3055 RepID=A8J3V1_CHLRE|nr:uncharacterized protein CHLRE_16g680100v5 [Chlamydomonas reinhardtii]PNW72157.1 hypothetical protein CHLRE_16g680100v5 [Chlamydomonas reinhardtii]|eukprot:XP_001695881.1 predicted protein [Chlamydomonas reinhardtii]